LVYANKEIYLKHSLNLNLVLLIAILAPFFVAERRSGIATIFGILIVGVLGGSWLLRLY